MLFIGPNNSGKTSALEALALWEIGLRRWNEKRKGRQAPEKRPGVTISRRDLVAVPVPDANLLWKDLHVRDVRLLDGKPETKQIRIEVVVDGAGQGGSWRCGLEFDYANEESFYCRPLRLVEEKNPEWMDVPEQAGHVRIAFLPPMSGLAASEHRQDRGTINVLIGQGRTAEVLRNLCYMVHQEHPARWEEIAAKVEEHFLAALEPPEYLPERGEIVVRYRERGVLLDLSCAGRGLQQLLLLLVYMYANPGSILLLDEPDAHLEALRQREVYHLLCQAAEANGNQIIAASHSEVLLTEAAGKHTVVAFVGKPHRIDGRAARIVTALRDIGPADFYQAERAGWILYLEGPGQLAMLKEFARTTGHATAEQALGIAFVKYQQDPAPHFLALREAFPKLAGVAVTNCEETLPDGLWAAKVGVMERYLCEAATLEAFAAAGARAEAGGPLFEEVEVTRRLQAMRAAISESPADEPVAYLTGLFDRFYSRLGLANIMETSSFLELAAYVSPERLRPEVTAALDLIARTASEARTRVNHSW